MKRSFNMGLNKIAEAFEKGQWIFIKNDNNYFIISDFFNNF